MSFTHHDLYAEVTRTIIAALEAGTPPWVCPWSAERGSILPTNATTGRPYRGVNVLLLNMRQMAHGYPCNRWLTFHQARSKGARIRKGEQGTQIVFFKLLERDEERAAREAANDEAARKVVPLLRAFTVFNVSQVDGLAEFTSDPTHSDLAWDPCEEADRLLSRSGATVRHGGNQAFYAPSQDLIQMPPRVAFESSERYYNVALHELTHWTGRSNRCNRPLLGRQHIEAYAFEELVAEMGSAFLSSHCGLPTQLHHASYISAWLQALHNDKRLIFTAASQAQRAADFLTGYQAQSGSGEAAAATAHASHPLTAT